MLCKAEILANTSASAVSFMRFDPGFYDQEESRVEPKGENPFAAKVLPMSSAAGAPE